MQLDQHNSEVKDDAEGVDGEQQPVVPSENGRSFSSDLTSHPANNSDPTVRAVVTLLSAQVDTTTGGSQPSTVTDSQVMFYLKNCSKCSSLVKS